MSIDLRPKTSGVPVQIKRPSFHSTWGGGAGTLGAEEEESSSGAAPYVFVAGQPQRRLFAVDTNSGKAPRRFCVSLCSGEARFADGSLAHAVLQVDEGFYNQVQRVGIFYPQKLVFLDGTHEGHLNHLAPTIETINVDFMWLDTMPAGGMPYQILNKIGVERMLPMRTKLSVATSCKEKIPFGDPSSSFAALDAEGWELYFDPRTIVSNLEEPTEATSMGGKSE